LLNPAQVLRIASRYGRTSRHAVLYAPAGLPAIHLLGPLAERIGRANTGPRGVLDRRNPQAVGRCVSHQEAGLLRSHAARWRRCLA
jgi:hypothetical protein